MTIGKLRVVGDWLPKPEHEWQTDVIKTKYVCGEHFCDACGDCMACCEGDFCHSTISGKHVVPVSESDG